MNQLEIILNLWYVFSKDDGLIYSLRARPYIQAGSDDEKLRYLQQHAKTDYLIAQPFPVPERYSTNIQQRLEKKKMPVMPKDMLETHGGPVTAANLFEEAFKLIENQMPAQTNIGIPQDPLICITPLAADDEGNISPQIDGVTRL